MTPPVPPTPTAPRRDLVAASPGAPGPLPRVPRAVPLALLALVWLVTIDIPDHVGSGRYSGGAALTVLTALACFTTLVGRMAKSSREDVLEPRLTATRRRVPLPLILFALWASVSAVLHTSVAGAQNVLVYDTFVGAVIACSAYTSAGSAERFLPWVVRAAWLVSAVYAVSLAADGLGAGSIYGPRSIALSGILLVAVAASRRKWLLALVVLVVIGASLSRTATVVAVAVLCLGIAVTGRGRAARFGRIAFWSIAGAVATGIAVTKIAPLRDRFLGGDAAVEVHGVRYNTSGRTQLWEFTWRLAHEHLLLGGGPGNAQNEVTSHFGVEISHPHNDYLRILNDLGVVGLGLFLLGLFAMLRATWIRGKLTGAPLHWAAFLGLLGIAVAAITDNALVYPFVMTPLGVVVGLSLAHPVPARASAEAPAAEDARPVAARPGSD